MAEKKKEKSLSLQQLKNQINKQYGEGTITIASQATGMKLVRIPTGSLGLDCETGGGYPRGRITVIAGPESTGKSYLALLAIAEAQKMYPDEECWWIDYEGSFVNEWAENFNIDLDRLVIVRPGTSEQALDIATVLLERSDVPMVVIDSLASMAPTAEVEGGMDDMTMGLAARQNNKFFRKAQSAFNRGSIEDGDNLKPAFIIINQLRDTMDKYKPETMPGGRGQNFAASIIIWVRVDNQNRYLEKQPDGSEKYVGHAIKFKTEKNKTFPPKRTGTFDIYVDESNKGFKAGQVDNFKETIVYAVKWGVIERAGAWYTILGNQEWRFQGGAKVLEFLLENKDVMDIVQQKVKTLATSSIRQGNAEMTIITDDGKEVDLDTGEILSEQED